MLKDMDRYNLIHAVIWIRQRPNVMVNIPRVQVDIDVSRPQLLAAA